jgi:hypothetical protein
MDLAGIFPNHCRAQESAMCRSDKPGAFDRLQNPQEAAREAELLGSGWLMGYDPFGFEAIGVAMRVSRDERSDA